MNNSEYLELFRRTISALLDAEFVFDVRVKHGETHLSAAENENVANVKAAVAALKAANIVIGDEGDIKLPEKDIKLP